jgi:hypothetical protein
MSETETWSLVPALHEYRTWALRNTPEDKQDDRFTLLIALVRSDGKIVASMPGWQGSEEDEDEQAFRDDMHGWLDTVLAKRRQADPDSFDDLDEENDHV